MRSLLVCLSILPLLGPLGCEEGGGRGLPPGAILAFEHACPDGWTRYAPLDGRFPRGAEVGGGGGGEAEHVHAFDITARTSKDGNHVHMLAGGEEVEVDTGFFGHLGIFKGYLQAFEEGGRVRGRAQRARAVTDEDGAHDHLISVTGDSEPGTSLPPYLDLVFCKKD